MKTNSRFVKSVVDSAKSDTPALPWTRGARRAAFVAKRHAEAEPAAKAA